MRAFDGPRGNSAPWNSPHFPTTLPYLATTNLLSVTIDLPIDQTYAVTTFFLNFYLFFSWC
jgi:hypothetical protein